MRLGQNLLVLIKKRITVGKSLFTIVESELRAYKRQTVGQNSDL